MTDMSDITLEKVRRFLDPDTPWQGAMDQRTQIAVYEAYIAQGAKLRKARAKLREAHCALVDVVNVLGPQVCECSPMPEGCGLKDEAAHALDIARAALGGDHA